MRASITYYILLFYNGNFNIKKFSNWNFGIEILCDIWYYASGGDYMPDKKSKYDISSDGRTYGRDRKGGWDIDTSDRTQRTSDGGHIPGRYQWEETVDVSDDD